MQINRSLNLPDRLICFLAAFFGSLSLVSLAIAKQGEEIKVDYRHGLLTVQNRVILRRFTIKRTGAIHTFFPSSWRWKIRDAELLSGQKEPWFEFCVEDQLIRSEEGGWKYTGYDLRKLENGGVEVVVHLRGQKSVSPVHGRLQMNYYLQIFPNSTITREKLEIVAQTRAGVRLTKYKSRIHFIFPRYFIRPGKFSKQELEEIRLAEWEGEILPVVDWSLRPNDRLRLSKGKSGRNLAQNHMYHPRRIITDISNRSVSFDGKGPIVLIRDDSSNVGWLTAYEHGSPDEDRRQDYLSLTIKKDSGGLVETAVRANKGAYSHGEKISRETGYSSVWVDEGPVDGNSFDQGEAAFWNFLYACQSEHLASREPIIYYNTWGMQRDEQKEKKKKPREVLTEERVLQEIEYAHQLGVDVFVIDDGWQTCFGDWQVNPNRFPNGFKKIKARLESLGMRLGLWMAAAGIDPNSKLYREHREWIVKNSNGSEATGRWKQPIACFSSGYKNYFVRLCKYWIDQGVTYFKWDGLDRHLCYSAEHDHGDATTPPEERACRSGYDFILSVTDAARQLTEYNPKVIIVYDVTESSRNVGLAFLSEGRFFWMNNGATWYDDLSTYRAKSIRTVASLYNQFIPTVLQTSANYPHQSEMYGAQHYNVNSTLSGGGGFWGDLSEMTEGERKTVGEEVRIYKKVARTVVATRPIVTGRIGSSPEIYEFINGKRSEGQVIAFSGSALQTTYSTQPVNRKKFFCVLRNSYVLREDGEIELPLLFPQADATCEAFVLSNQDCGFSIERSTCWLKEADITSTRSFTYINGAAGRQRIIWPRELGSPQLISDHLREVQYEITENEHDFILTVEEALPEIAVTIFSEER